MLRFRIKDYKRLLEEETRTDGKRKVYGNIKRKETTLTQKRIGEDEERSRLEKGKRARADKRREGEEKAEAAFQREKNEGGQIKISLGTEKEIVREEEAGGRIRA